MITPKPRVQVGARRPKTQVSDAETQALELFPTKAEAPATPPTHWRGCVVCGAKDGLRAHPAHDVCLSCAADPPAARARLEVQRAALIRQQHQAATKAAEAWGALSDEERARWEAFALLRARADSGAALAPDEARRLAATRAAYAAPDHPRISAAQRAYFGLEECLFWASEAAAEGQRRLDAQLAQLSMCLKDLGRKDEADALYH